MNDVVDHGKSLVPYSIFTLGEVPVREGLILNHHFHGVEKSGPFLVAFTFPVLQPGPSHCC